MSNNCYLSDSCKAFKNNPDCVNQGPCEKLSRIDVLLDKALLNENQKKNPHLKVGKKGEDTAQMQRLIEVLFNRIEEFVSSGESLCIRSEKCGNGKTSWAIRAIQVYINKIWTTSPLCCRALFISVPKFLSALKSNMTNPDSYVKYILDNIETADIVVWDDLATKPLTEFEADKLFTFIDTRISLGKSNIYTFNIKRKDDSDEDAKEAILDILGARLYSRIIRPSYDIVFVSSDKRELKK